MNNRFKGGLAGSTYKCGWCGRLTRETGYGESSLRLCAYDMREAEEYNRLQDGHITDAKYQATMLKLKAEYSR